MNDPVHNPSHYKSGGIEVIDVIEAFGLDSNFRLANVVKYVLRAGRKGDALQDLKKAAWYLDREIGKMEDEAEADEAACNATPKATEVDITNMDDVARRMVRVLPDAPTSESQEYDG